jgi:predicted dehydrogenase
LSDSAVKVGVVGLGRMGQNHVRVLSMLKGVEISFVYDVDRAKSARVAEAAGVRAVQEIDLAFDEVDALIIASPTITHSQYVARAAKSVRNLLVEKPLADSIKRAEEVATLARECALNIQVGFIERFNPAVQQLRSVLDGSHGVVAVDFARTNKISARVTDVDVVADLMIHDIDLALYLNGPVAKVAAHGIAQDNVIDFASAVLTHENGRFSRLLASRITEKKMRLIQATCRNLFVECDLLRKEIAITRQSEVVQPEGEPYTIIATEETLEVRPQEALVLELQTFLRSCRGNLDEDLPGVNAGLEAMRVCAAVQRAILPH